MIEKFIIYSDLLALLLAIAISGLIIFLLFFIGFIHSDTEHVGTDSDIDADTDVDTDFDTDVDTDIHIATDIDGDFDTDFDSDLDSDFDTEIDSGIDTDIETDIEGDIGSEVHLDTEAHVDSDHEVSGDTNLNMDMDAHVGGELVRTIETDGGGSLFAQIGAFCLAFGLFGFFFVLSIGPVESSELLSKLDIAVALLFLLGVCAFKLSNRGLKALTKGSISPVSEIMAGQHITVVSKLIDYQTQGRVLVATPDGEKIMMAISHDMHDLFYEGDKGIILLTGIPLRIAKELTELGSKQKGF